MNIHRSLSDQTSFSRHLSFLSERMGPSWTSSYHHDPTSKISHSTKTLHFTFISIYLLSIHPLIIYMSLPLLFTIIIYLVSFPLTLWLPRQTLKYMSPVLWIMSFFYCKFLCTFPLFPKVFRFIDTGSIDPLSFIDIGPTILGLYDRDVVLKRTPISSL